MIMDTATQELEKEEVTATPGSTARLIREVKASYKFLSKSVYFFHSAANAEATKTEE